MATQQRAASYRPDIDGLRALAVLAVVGFHAEISALRGGFVGVDVFFVISGYLISGIILRALERDTFTFAEFYTRRINRILPALIVVLSATAILGWGVLFSEEFASLGKHVVAGSTFVSNFALWNEAGYFDSAAKPLLHLWSLAVEEQFYLFWPWLLLVAWKRRTNLATLMSIVVMLSFVLSITLLHFSFGNAAFYSPATRLWEIGAGGLLCVLETRQLLSRLVASVILRTAVSVAGLLLLVASILKIDSSTPWPGWWALAPVVGTLLIIASGPLTWISGKFLGSKPLVAIGLISYPLYLWHWPLLVLSRLVNEGQLPRLGRLTVVALSMVLAFLTYRLVEIPIRFGGHKRRSAVRLLVGLAVVGLIGVALWSGFDPRLNAGSFDGVAEAHNDGEYPGGGFIGSTRRMKVNVTPGDSMHAVLFVGDSHMEQYWPRAAELSREVKGAGPQAIFISHEGCPSLPNVNRNGLSVLGALYHCDDFFRQAMTLAESPRVTSVVIGGYWENYLRPGSISVVGGDKSESSADAVSRGFEMLQDQIAKLRAQNKNVFLVLSNPVDPRFQPDSILLPRRLPGLAPRSVVTSIPRARVIDETSIVSTRLRNIALKTGATIIDPLDSMCDATKCPTVDARGLPIYRDANHMRASYARRAATFMDRTFLIRK